MTEYKSKDLQQLFDKSTETIRTWADEFNQFLSPTATPGEGRHRLFSSDDLRVMALVNEMKTQGKRYEDIHAALANGQRGDVEEQTVERALSLETAIALDKARHQLEVMQLEREQDRKTIQELHDENIRLKTKLEMMEEQDADADALRQEIIELNRKMAVLEYQLEQNKDD